MGGVSGQHSWARAPPVGDGGGHRERADVDDVGRQTGDSGGGPDQGGAPFLVEVFDPLTQVRVPLQAADPSVSGIGWDEHASGRVTDAVHHAGRVWSCRSASCRATGPEHLDVLCHVLRTLSRELHRPVVLSQEGMPGKPLAVHDPRARHGRRARPAAASGQCVCRCVDSALSPRRVRPSPTTTEIDVSSLRRIDQLLSDCGAIPRASADPDHVLLH